MNEGEEAVVETQETQVEERQEEKKDLYVPKIEDEAVQARINQLYGKTKFLERTNGELAVLNKNLLDRLEKLENNVNTKETNDRVAILKAASVKALEDGNYRAATEISVELAKLAQQTEKKIEAKPPEVNIETTELGEDDEARYKAWLVERDESGNYKRPWAFDGHPLNKEVVEITQGLLVDPRYRNLSEIDRNDAVLKELDRLMGPKPKAKPAAAAVLSGEDHRPGRKAGLSEEQKQVARMMGLSEEQYAAAVQKYGRKAK